MTSPTARKRAAGVNVPTNWIRGPRLTAEDLHVRAVQRSDYRKMLKTAHPDFTDEWFYAPHRNRGTVARKHKNRANIEKSRLLKGGRTITRLSVRP